MYLQLGGSRPSDELNMSNREHRPRKTSTTWKYKQSEGNEFRKLRTKN
ncbi:hypothetical protein PC116_g9462 [Phytophthora cactorum]|uniref:Uncharacterized protein n=1 Tax=Phytophthora cactorum TaxID=29920 RepID=A0A8T0ZJQ7_9STRA|nr:hypothetical protein PC113_g6569 [Phytophthora cactorum]KAG2918439.1 hypothetical protein PC114_g6817 [Phytophthora cactorum]KAG2932527.1 hypothetical protein PC115_g5764 [Phytophthora cactorum]KAG2947633.1 hypothetical protein PC117_g6662 [Phytophthora cactorum]KAG3011022.1 hypothetical protein PC120_g14707 [Phytophthora cactorum]